MARFDVYRNPDPGEHRRIPYLLDVQNDHIGALATRVVVPLWREDAFGPPARDLNPVVTVGDDRCVLDTAALAAVPATDLCVPVARLHHERERIHDALDTLFGAY